MLAKVCNLPPNTTSAPVDHTNMTCPDFLAHSNYTELALIELGERDIFPHVGRNTRIRIEGARGEVYPIVTGTFGGVDFLHSVTGEGMAWIPGMSNACVTS
jgi:hypothetical protein